MAQSGGFITIQVGGLTPTKRRLVTWGASITDLAPAWELVGEDLLHDFLWQITSEGGTYGRSSKWAPLAPATVKEREKLYPGFGAHPIMWREGTLLYSLAQRGAPGNVFDVSPTSLRVGSEIPYAKYHQTGNLRMPRRQLVGISWRRRQGIVRRLNDYVQEQARQQGLLGG